jgi:putative ABC transport system ATP-binding protein
MIILKKINLTFAPDTIMAKKALKNLSLTIEEGDFVTVIGSNGAGKSTMLNTISGDVIVDSGQIIIDGQKVTKKPVYLRTQSVSRVFQDPLQGSCPDLTIAENMALALRRGKSKNLDLAIKKNTFDFFKDSLKILNLNLEDRINTKISMLSGGQRQAISLLMSTLSPLKILLLDEHTAALDPKTAHFIMELTDKIVRERKITTLMVTHSLSQALQYGNRTVMLHDGHVIADLDALQRSKMTPNDLMQLFGKTIDDDRILLSE